MINYKTMGYTTENSLGSPMGEARTHVLDLRYPINISEVKFHVDYQYKQMYKVSQGTVNADVDKDLANKIWKAQAQYNSERCGSYILSFHVIEPFNMKRIMQQQLEDNIREEKRKLEQQVEQIKQLNKQLNKRKLLLL